MSIRRPSRSCFERNAQPDDTKHHMLCGAVLDALITCLPVQRLGECHRPLLPPLLAVSRGGEDEYSSRRSGGGGRRRSPPPNNRNAARDKKRRRGRPAWLRSPNDSPYRDGNRDRLIGLLTDRLPFAVMQGRMARCDHALGELET